jgi:CRISPR-associated protein Cas1
MRKLLNTLYVTTQKSYLARDGETVAVRLEHETKVRVPLHTLSGIVCFGTVACSPPLLALCAEHKVAVSFLSENGEYLARVQGPTSGNVLLRRAQYRAADDAGKSASIARSILVGKLLNSRTVLQRAARERDQGQTGREALEAAARRLGYAAGVLRGEMGLDEARGVEGDAASTYFSVFDHLITVQKEAFLFESRTRRPPLNNVNAMLSFTYTLLAHDVAAALETVGLDPAVGYLHRDRPGRPGLALDLMEEFRPLLADRLVLSLINRKQVDASGFVRSETGGISMDSRTRHELLVGYQQRKQEEIQHPFLEEKVPVGLLPFIQANLLARHIREDLEAYPPFLWK